MKVKRKNKDLIWRRTLKEHKSKMLLLLDYIDWQESSSNVLSEYKVLKLWDCENQRQVVTYIDNSMHNLRNWNTVLQWDRNDNKVIIMFGYFIDKTDETGKPILSLTKLDTWNDLPIIDADGNFLIEELPFNESVINELYENPVHVDLPPDIIKPKRENKYAN